MKNYNITLTIAGSDPSGGAGTQADIKAISACGGFAQAVITSLTSQNSMGVQGIFIVPADVVRSQLDSVLDDIVPGAVKIGMLPTDEIIDVVADVILKYRLGNVVLDPVMVSTSGAKLVSNQAINVVREKLMPLCDIITPNISEASLLSGVEIRGEQDFDRAAGRLLDLGAKSVLLKAGHLEGDKLTDHLYYNGEIYNFTNQRVYTNNTHGTGCTLSSAMAAYLSAGKSVPEATQAAIEYLNGAIVSGAEYYAGKGHGAVDHFWRVK